MASAFQGNAFQSNAFQTNILTSQTQDGRARITVVVAAGQTGQSRITGTQAPQQTGQSRIQASQAAALTGISRITRTEAGLQPGTARITVGAIHTALGRARITAPALRVQTGIARIREDVLYSRESAPSLPANAADLAIAYDFSEEILVGADDGVKVALLGDGYLIHQFKRGHSNNIDTIGITWNGCAQKPTSLAPVYLQIYNNNTAGWETLDSDNATPAAVDFTLTGNQVANISDYYDGLNTVAIRVFQQL